LHQFYRSRQAFRPLVGGQLAEGGLLVFVSYPLWDYYLLFRFGSVANNLSNQSLVAPNSISRLLR